MAADHYNCPIGSHTHNMPLPTERAAELNDTLGVVVYAPLAATPVDPDVVLFWGPPGTVMLLQEAAIRAGAAAQLNMLGRPTCMAVPAALSHGAVASTGCIGNRVYTGLDESELYVAVPGRDLQRIADDTTTITSANATPLAYHESRKRELARV